MIWFLFQLFALIGLILIIFILLADFSNYLFNKKPSGLTAQEYAEKCLEIKRKNEIDRLK